MIPSFGPRATAARFLFNAAASREAGQIPVFAIEPGVPIISDPNPAPGDFSTDREEDRRTHVLFRYTRQNPLAVPMIWCRVGSEWFAVFQGLDDSGFLGIFSGFSAVTRSGENDFDFDLHPAGGWWGRVEIHGGDVVEAGVLEG